MATAYQRLQRLIKERKALIGVIGLGYVGLPLVLRFCEEGFGVLGFEVDPKNVDSLNRGISYIKHIPSEKLSKYVGGKSPIFTATTDKSRLKEADAIIICVPTPLTDKRKPDLKYVTNTAKKVSKYLIPGHFIFLGTTTHPDSTHGSLPPPL